MSSFIYALYLSSLLSKGLKMAHQRKAVATKANNMSLNPRTQGGQGLGGSLYVQLPLPNLQR